MALPWYVTGAPRPSYAKPKSTSRGPDHLTKSSGYSSRPKPKPSPRPTSTPSSSFNPVWSPAPQPAWTPSPQPAWTPPMVVQQPTPVVVAQPATPRNPPAQSWRNFLDWITTVPDAMDERRAKEQRDQQVTAPNAPRPDSHVLPLPQVNPQTIGITAQGFVPPAEQSVQPITVLNDEGPTFFWEKPEAREAVRRYKKRNTDRQEEAEPLTWDEYNAMTPEGQAAVQFNDALFKAIERDRENQEKYEDRSEEEQDAYWGTVRDIFGTDVFPEVEGLRIAPETVAVLSQLEIPSYKDTGKGLDDYLRFDTAITEEDIKKLDTQLPALKFGPTPVEGNDTSGYEYTPQQQRIATAQQLTRAQQALNETLANGDLVLANAAGIAANMAATEFGAEPRNLFSSPKSDYPEARFNQYFEALADPNYGVEDTWNQIQEDVADKSRDDKEAKQVMRALLNRLSEYGSGALDWSTLADGQTIARARPIEEVFQGLRIPTVKQPETEGDNG